MKIAVYDLGGGTLICLIILELGDGVFEAKSTNGRCAFRWWIDFDHTIIEWLAENFKMKKNGFKKIQWHSKIKEAAEKVKIELSSSSELKLTLPLYHCSRWRSKTLSEKIIKSKIWPIDWRL